MIKMMKEKIFADEVMTFEELDKVSGSTVAELDELRGAILDKGIFNTVVNNASTVATKKLPPGNLAFAYYLEKRGLKAWGVDAHISVGVLGSGLGSTNNLYFNRRNGGKPMTHEEVVTRIKSSTRAILF